MVSIPAEPCMTGLLSLRDWSAASGCFDQVQRFTPLDALGEPFRFLGMAAPLATFD